MRPSHRRLMRIFSCLGFLLVGAAMPLFAQNIQVTSATPASADQGTISLDVTIAGSGFKNGSKAAWYVSGTTNPGGVTVNSTKFNSSSELVANITVSDTATVGSFDIMVTSAGRTGKGTGLFSVASKVTPSTCATMGTPAGFSLVTALNYVNSSGTAQYQTGLGITINVRRTTVTNGTSSRDILVAAVGTANGNGKVEFFFLDPATGMVLDGQPLFPGGPVQPHFTVPQAPNLTNASGALAGNLNGDNLPDFIIRQGDPNSLVVYFGRMDANGILDYGTPTVLSPLALRGVGNFDSDPLDELVEVISGGKVHGKTVNTVVNIYKFDGSGFVLVNSLEDPTQDPSNGFGHQLAVGDVTGDGVPDLIVSAPQLTVGGAASAGALYVFPSPLTSSTNFRLTSGGAGDQLGWTLGVGALSSSTATDVIATTRYPGPDKGSTTNPRALIYSGPITSNRTSSSFDFFPYAGLADGWASALGINDINGDGRVEVAVGALNAGSSTSCTNIGAVHFYLANPSNPAQPTISVFQPTDLTTGYGGMGFGIAIMPFTPGEPQLLLLGERSRQVGGVTNAGQVYVYKKN